MPGVVSSISTIFSQAGSLMAIASTQGSGGLFGLTQRPELEELGVENQRRESYAEQRRGQPDFEIVRRQPRLSVPVIMGLSAPYTLASRPPTPAMVTAVATPLPGCVSLLYSEPCSMFSTTMVPKMNGIGTVTMKFAMSIFDAHVKHQGGHGCGKRRPRQPQNRLTHHSTPQV